jgi:hypothetical protein
VFPVLKVGAVIPFYVFTVSVVDSNPRTFSCYSTPYETFCEEDGIDLTIISSPPVLTGFNELYFFSDFHGFHYYSSQAQPPGNPTSCGLGNIQLNSLNSSLLDSSAVVYQGFCDSGLEEFGYSPTQCSYFYSDYGSALPYHVPGVGNVNFINNTNAGFSGYVATSLDHSTSVTIDLSLNGDFQFTNNKTDICPNVNSISDITGCYNCPTPASFSISAFSSCLEGVAYVKCSEPILNPAIYLNNTANTFILNFDASSKNPKLNCIIQGATRYSFQVITSIPLSSSVVSLGGPTQNGLPTFQNNNGSVSKPKDNTNHILLIAIIVIVCAILLFGGLCIVGCCLMKVVGYLLKEYV